MCIRDRSNTVLAKVRFFLGDTFGVYYLAIGLGVFLLSLYLAFSKYGDIVLGEQDEKPKYSFFAWGSMMFTCGLDVYKRQLLRSSVHKQNRDIVLKTIESENFQEILPLLQVKQPQRRSKKEIIKRVLKKLCGLG